MLPAQKFGRYRLVEQLGRGGMATVFRARDPEFDRDVAIKVLPEELLQDPEFRSRFQREARAIARLEHPAIVPVYDIGEEHGQPFLVMRFMPGGTLGQKLAKGPLPIAADLAVVRRVSAALDEAHRRGMVHRDIKPGNILFDSYNEAYLSDFGIVKWSQASTTLTGTGMIGTPAYMSPEQSEGRSDVGPPADIYALGVVLFQMLTGRLPFEADTPIGLALKHIREAVPQLTAIDPTAPAATQEVIERAMAKRPEARYPTAGHLARALEKAVSTSGQAADAGATAAEREERDATSRARPSPPLPLSPTLRASRRHVRALPVVVVLTVVGLAGAALVVALGGKGALSASPQPSLTPEASAAASPTARILASSTPAPLPSAIEVPAGISAENVAEVGLLWSSKIATRNSRFSVAWSPAGDTIAFSAPAQAGVALWDANLARQTDILKDTMGIFDLGSLAWAPDGGRLAALVELGSAGADRWSLDIWRLPEGEVVLRIPVLGFGGLPEWSPDGRYLSCGSSMYDAETGDLLWTVPGNLGLSAFSPDSSLVALGGTGGDARLYDTATGLAGLTLPAHQIALTGLSWSATDILASGAWNGEVFVWPELSRTAGDHGTPITADTGGIFDLAWSPSGELLLSANLDHKARLWDQDLQLTREFEHEGVVVSVTWSPDGRRFATGAQDGLLRVWGLADP